jgi:hypothetical protein
MRQDAGSFVRQVTDKLRLATSVHKNQPVFLSRRANHRQATDDLLKNWFRTIHGGQEYEVFVIIERQYFPESDNDSYDPFIQGESRSKRRDKPEMAEDRTKLVIKKEDKDVKPVIKEEGRTKSTAGRRKERGRKQPIIKTEQDESPVRLPEPDISDSRTASRKRSRSDLSSPLREPTQASYPYRTRQRHELDEEDLERIAQYD